jgi:hypothetical protein
MRRFIPDGVAKAGPPAGPGKRSLAVVPQTSFLETPATYKRLLTEVGLEIIWERSGPDDALKSFDQQTAAQQGSSALPPLGVHVTMGSGAVPKRAQELGASAASIDLVLAAELRAQQPLLRTYARDERRYKKRCEKHPDPRTKGERPAQRVDEQP